MVCELWIIVATEDNTIAYTRKLQIQVICQSYYFFLMKKKETNQFDFIELKPGSVNKCI